MTSWAEDRRAKQLEWDYERMVALTVACVDDCEAPDGEDCRNLRTGKPLEHQPAHRKRIDAGLAKAAAEVES